MKINPISMTERFSKAKHTTKGTLDTDIKVKRIPSHKGNTDTFVNTYGEKILKRYGIVECETCLARVYTDVIELNSNREVSGDICICPECGRCYDDKGIVNITKLEAIDYDSKLEFLEGVKIDKKV